MCLIWVGMSVPVISVIMIVNTWSSPVFLQRQSHSIFLLVEYVHHQCRRWFNMCIAYVHGLSHFTGLKDNVYIQGDLKILQQIISNVGCYVSVGIEIAIIFTCIIELQMFIIVKGGLGLVIIYELPNQHICRMQNIGGGFEMCTLLCIRIYNNNIASIVCSYLLLEISINFIFCLNLCCLLNFTLHPYHHYWSVKLLVNPFCYYTTSNERILVCNRYM